MRGFFLVLFWLVSLVHLYGSFINNKRIRNASKGLILLSLLGYYISSVSTPWWLVIVALLFCWIGDLLLIHKKGFTLGGFSFSFGHFCFIAVFLPQIRLAAVPWYAYVLWALVYGTTLFFLLRSLRGSASKRTYVAMCAYMAVNTLMNAAALMQLISLPSLATALVFVGAVLFFVSDAMVLVVRMHRTKELWRQHFLVMLTYIIAKFLIVQGIILLSL